MIRIIALSGSLRRESFNTNLLRVAQTVMPIGSELVLVTIAGIPLYNGDDESAHGIPASVTALQDAIAAADGLLISTPEYNNSMPGVLKNAIDWLSRPPEHQARVFGDLPVAVIGASPGAFGTVLAQNAWLTVLRTLSVRPWTAGRLYVSGASRVFDAQGQLTDDGVRQRLTKFMQGFTEFAASAPRKLTREV